MHFGQVWEKYELDAIVCPTQAVPQLPHGYVLPIHQNSLIFVMVHNRGCDNFSALALATMVYNVLDLPAGCLPVTRVNPSLDAVTEEWFQEGGHGSSLFENGVFKGEKRLYDPESLEGMPVCVQVVCKKWEEEKLLRVMSLIDETLGERGFGPGAVDRQAASKST